MLKWIALAIAFAVSVSSHAQQTTKPRQAGADTTLSDSDAATGDPDTANQVLGKIQSLANDRDTITLDVAGKSQHYKLSNSTTVFIRGRLGSAEDLKEGQQVRAAFETKDGAKTLRWIQVTPALVSIPPPDTQPGVHAPSGGLGVVSSISPQRQQIVVRYGTLTTSILLNEATEITKGGAPASALDIRPGMEIRATLDTTRTTATRVDIVNQQQGQ